jgi:hypothetical protein
LSLFAPAFLALARIFRLGHRLGIDLDDVSVDQIKDICVALLAGGGGCVWLVKRIRAGNNPASAARPVRLTNA